MSEDKSSKGKANSLKKYLVLTGIAFEMGAIIFVFAYAGKWLDAQYSADKKWFTMLCVLAGVGISLYLVIKQLNKINKNQE